MPSLCVIIPVYKDDESLTALLRNMDGMDIAQIIICDAQPRTKIPALHIPDAVRAICEWTSAPKGRGPQIKAGLERARADHVWIVHADSRLDSRAPQAISKILSNPKTRMGTFTLKFDSPERALKLFAWISRADTPLTTFGDQGFFFRRKDYAALDLNLADFPLLEDLALRRAFKRAGRIKRSALTITTSNRRFARRGIWATQIFNAQILWRYRIRREDPAALYRAYYAPLMHPTPPCRKAVQIGHDRANRSLKDTRGGILDCGAKASNI